jgi:hypothetical protein
MPEDKPTGQAESKPEEPKPEPKPSTPPESKQPEYQQGKARGKYVNYQDLSKEELVRMLMRVNKRLTRVNKELKEIIGILYYGNTPQEGGGQNSGYRNRRNYGYSKYGGRYGNRQYGYKGSYGRQRRSENEDEDVNYD